MLIITYKVKGDIMSFFSSHFRDHMKRFFVLLNCTKRAEPYLNFIQYFFFEWKKNEHFCFYYDTIDFFQKTTRGRLFLRDYCVCVCLNSFKMFLLSLLTSLLPFLSE